MSKKGRLTFPIDVSIMDRSVELMKEWGADAIRDCDGTTLPSNVGELGVKIYSTYFVTRGDNKWAKANLDELQHMYVMSERVTAHDGEVSIPLLHGFLTDEVEVDYDADPKKYWEVIDRTTDKVISEYTVDRAHNTVTIKPAENMHEYTVIFFVRVIWDSTQMYNYITNNWDREKEMPYDPRYPKTNKYIKDHLREWLKSHPDTDVVRFTTFLYHFALLFNDKRREKFVDWFGYGATCSPKAMDDFEKEYGYRLRPEDIVTAGSYNSPFKVPTKQYLDYMDFIGKFVCDECRQLVDIVHENGREAMMFLGDTWIGTEPYGKYFGNIGLDAIVGSVGSGITVRMLTDMPHVKYSEGRFLPYFFPDTFREGGKPTEELNEIWRKARRAMMIKPLDRMGFGGYLNLADKFPDFIKRVGEICDEFRDIYDTVKGSSVKTSIKVGVLNCWGKLRSWQAFMVAHELWYKQTYSYMEVFEALSGLPVDIEFINFGDVLAGRLNDFNIVLNVGNAGTAFSGGKWWNDVNVITKVREWVYNGGGFIGIGEPTAFDKQETFFALRDVLGVDKELGFTLSTDKYNIVPNQEHFILEGIDKQVTYGESTKGIYALEGATVLDIARCGDPERDVNVGEVQMAVNAYGKGAGFYMSGFKFDNLTTRLLYRAMLYISGKTDLVKRGFSTNFNTDYYYYEDKKRGCLINNSTKTEETTLYDMSGKAHSVTLNPLEMKWL